MLRNKINAMKLLLPILLFGSFITFAQPLTLKNNQGGIISLGVRTTISAFNGHHGSTGTGLGGQFRIQFADKVNSDWFFDYLNSDVGDFAKRTDYHIGWSVLFYPMQDLDPQFRPFILAGHCFDYTLLVDNSNRSNSIERWSSAVQGGLGTHCRLTQRLDLTLKGQYMIHLGTHIDAEKISGQVVYTKEPGASLEGHLLFTVGINYKIADLW